MMPTRPGRLLGVALVVALLALPACTDGTGTEVRATESPATESPATESPATESPATESADSPAEASSTPPAEEMAPHEMTCAEIKETFGSEEYEDEASYLAVWAYGVRTGVEGLDFDSHPVTQAGLEAFITRLILVCDSDPEKLFVDAFLE